MEQAKVLVRSVVRAFYETEHVVLIDALVFHSALSLADLALVMDLGKQTKTVQKLCGRLREGGLISVYARSEQREGQQKPSTREYYYIDYRRAIDATKYRIYQLDELIKQNSKPTQEKKELSCPRCQSQFTLMEAMDNIDPMGGGSGFLCKRCGNHLDYRHTDADMGPEEDDTPAKFNKQFKSILELLQLIDKTVVPPTTGEFAMEALVPVPRDETTNPQPKTEILSQSTIRPTAVKGIASEQKVDVNLTTSKESSVADHLSKIERRAHFQAQNKMPEWYRLSTVTGEETGAGIDKSEPHILDFLGPPPKLKAEIQDEEDKKNGGATLDAYFLALEAEKEREKLAAQEEDTDEDEEEDEFEDVVTAATSVEAGEGSPQAKRVKMDEPMMSGAKVETSSAVPSATGTPAGEESDEDDFEDAL
ncbi:hypothetical protein M501DRAFT_1061762 [Patellaria atrata CBS 101060]|uniref:HTH TFE/IIEalpha-type domain-containing protein n=1 Tax=Patellaria atrata CBS 101060 TaxID=1346257 RepID=A0A9P4S2E7_9PEZI|nr:hypothetical protein M501DRAFT_1061762 [Patellaria atrata CBS 101060]